MKNASDFRAIARQALSGRWAIAVVAGLIALVLGGVSGDGPKIELNLQESGGSVAFSLGGQPLISTDGEWSGILAGAFSGLFFTALVVGALWFLLGSIIRVGYARFNLELVDRGKEPDLNGLFGYFSHWKNVVLTALLQGLYVFLWSLLLVIPGIVASYSYAMTGYILAECPELTPGKSPAPVFLRRNNKASDDICIEKPGIPFLAVSQVSLYVSLGRDLVPEGEAQNQEAACCLP